jgi:hypothetical protein
MTLKPKGYRVSLLESPTCLKGNRYNSRFTLP